MMRHFALLGLMSAPLLAGCVPSEPAPVAAPPPAAALAAPVAAKPALSPLVETRVLSREDADRLLATSGITLQWIGWDQRGDVSVYRDKRGIWWLSGTQTGSGGERLLVEGQILEIGDGYFTLRGPISIHNAPDAGRSCREDKMWHFAITQNRQYYRLREFEWCDGLTDYIDIYF